MLGGISTKSRKALGRFLILIAAALGLWAVFYLLLLVEGDGALALYALCAYVLPPLCALLLPFVAAMGIRPQMGDVALLLVFGIVTTAFAHTLFISSLKDIPARLAGVCSSMETVYGILFALILLGEVPSLREILGGAVILCAVVYAQLRE